MHGDDALLDLLRRYESGQELDDEQLDRVAREMGFETRVDLVAILRFLGALRGRSAPTTMPPDVARRLRGELRRLLEERETGAAGGSRSPVGSAALRQALVRCLKDSALRTRLAAGPRAFEELAGIQLSEEEYGSLLELLRPSLDEPVPDDEALEDRVAAIVFRFLSDR